MPSKKIAKHPEARNFTIRFLSKKEDTVELSVSAQEIVPVTYVL